ncbi:hypothetical protein PF005_g12131 [Phytophthora fragariae]|uniref:Uncharacterized protein n=1 Tax=Phytophthora fragariae TaxID=53985 RepID=A0A6A3XUQ4_9STRA|nr:hypothetical protein PF003_g1321 [Phytophthora fragariae]KAE8943594.1 hypothetical protein PF009_g6706 [Phytophthora fragariae]KAE8991898.1 hypothetical protein PF011_g17761 [Phytophthora fragariae]KAE9111017.1 hypothetical protein PF007_g11634 [Phytophthora fragariae]KAE9117700.1 hypothetical protein PF010_g8506 [Phytophthora fragariae]
MNLLVVPKPFITACLVLILVSRFPLCFPLSTMPNTAVMSAPKPTKNAISPTKEFKTLYITASNTYTIRVSNEVIRHLRLTMNTTVPLLASTRKQSKSLSPRSLKRSSAESTLEMCASGSHLLHPWMLKTRAKRSGSPMTTRGRAGVLHLQDH